MSEHKDSAGDQAPADQTLSALAQKKLAAELENALAQLALERARTEREMRRLSLPWWRSWNITALGAILAAIAPLTAGVQGYWEKSKQLALEERHKEREETIARDKQTEEIRNRYLDRVKDPKESRRVLRFLIATSTDSAVREWATAEQSIVEAEAQMKVEKAEKAAQLVEQAEAAHEAQLRRTRDETAIRHFLEGKAKQLRDESRAADLDIPSLH